MTIIEKNTKNNGLLIIKEIDYNTAKEMMIKNHYSHKWNTSFGKINIGIFKNNILLGACVFGNLMNPKGYKNITKLGGSSIIELNRMWLDDSLVKNAETVLISSSFKIIKNDYPEIKFIQSFADGRLGCGTVYKASNFKYYGFNESLFFENIENKEVFHKVPLENTKRPNGFINKNRLYLDKKLRPFKVKTYRYIYSLYKNTLPEIEEKPYPHYEKGEISVEYAHPVGLLSRLAIMFKEINDDVYYEKTMAELKYRFNENEIEEEMLKQKDNDSLKWFKSEYIKNSSNIKKLFENKE